MQDKTVVTVKVLDESGKLIETLVNNQSVESGTHELSYNVTKLKPGVYFAMIENSNQIIQSIKFTVAK